MSPIRRWLVKSARTVHLYITLFGVSLLLFFAVTGFMLNHEDWFLAADRQPRTVEGTVPLTMLQPLDKFAVVELLRKDYAANGAADPIDDDEEAPVMITFRQPGRLTVARIEREDGKLEVSYKSDGFYGILLDLHRGKASGKAWSLVIDGLCILVVIVALTGFYLWASLRGRGRFTTIVFLVGLALGFVVFFVFVP